MRKICFALSFGSTGTLGRRGSRATQKPLPDNIERCCTGGTGIPDQGFF